MHAKSSTSSWRPRKQLLLRIAPIVCSLLCSCPREPLIPEASSPIWRNKNVERRQKLHERNRREEVLEVHEFIANLAQDSTSSTRASLHESVAIPAFQFLDETIYNVLVQSMCSKNVVRKHLNTEHCCVPELAISKKHAGSNARLEKHKFSVKLRKRARNLSGVRSEGSSLLKPYEELTKSNFALLSLTRLTKCLKPAFIRRSM